MRNVTVCERNRTAPGYAARRAKFHGVKEKNR